MIFMSFYRFSSTIDTILAQLEATPTAGYVTETTLARLEPTPTTGTMFEVQPLSIVAANITDLFISGRLSYF